METTVPFIPALIGAAIALCACQWYMWRNRAVSAVQQCQAAKGRVDTLQFQLNHLDDERQRHHDLMQETFDYINDNGPWGANDITMIELRNKLLSAISESTVGRT